MSKHFNVMEDKMKTTHEKLINTLKAGVCAFALVGLFATNATPAFATTETKDTTQTSQQIEKNAQDKTAEKRREIVSEAVAALDDTRAALKALDDKDGGKALSILQGVTGKLEIILARDPGLNLVPAAVTAVTYGVIATPEDVRRMRGQAEDLLNEGKIQAARRLLQVLASETDINTSNIPLVTYPAAIKQAAKLIDEGKMEDAKNVLQTALNTVVVTQTIVPLPVVAAQEMLKEAEKLAESKERKDEDNKRLTVLLDGAQTSIKLAQELGYGQKNDFEHFYEEIDKIRDKTSDGKSGTGFFDLITGYMTSMTKDSQPEKTPNKT
jgi:hypothetical protein